MGFGPALAPIINLGGWACWRRGAATAWAWPWAPARAGTRPPTGWRIGRSQQISVLHNDGLLSALFHAFYYALSIVSLPHTGLVDGGHRAGEQLPEQPRQLFVSGRAASGSARADAVLDDSDNGFCGGGCAPGCSTHGSGASEAPRASGAPDEDNCEKANCLYSGQGWTPSTAAALAAPPQSHGGGWARNHGFRGAGPGAAAHSVAGAGAEWRRAGVGNYRGRGGTGGARGVPRPVWGVIGVRGELCGGASLL